MLFEFIFLKSTSEPQKEIFKRSSNDNNSDKNVVIYVGGSSLTVLSKSWGSYTRSPSPVCPQLVGYSRGDSMNGTPTVSTDSAGRDYVLSIK